MSGRRAAFVDRDGVVNELVRDPASGERESPLSVDDVALIPGAVEGLAALAGAGFLLVGVTNQPAAAKGTVSRTRIEQIQERVIELLAAEGIAFDAFEICLHHPDGILPELSGPCECRKPAPGMLLRAARNLAIDLGRSWMVGDTDADVLAGRAAGCRTALIENPSSAHKRSGSILSDVSAPRLPAAVELILAADEAA